MKKKTTLSPVTLGTVQLGLKYGIANREGKPDREKAFAILDEARNCKINCLDTAAGYGDSEKVIGDYIRSRGEKNFMIATKFKLGEIANEKAAETLRRSVEKSLINLGVGSIDFLLLHDAAEHMRYGVEIDGEIEKLISEGKVKKVGASGYCYEDIRDMLDNELYEAFQLPVNLLDYRIEGTDRIKRLIGKTIFARSIYLQGLFFREPESLSGNLECMGPYIQKINELAIKFKISKVQLAAGYVKSLDYVDSIVIGADNPSQVRENADTILARPLNGSMIKEIRETLAGVPEWVFYPQKWDEEGGR